MSKTIYNVSLLDILPDNLKSDPDMIAAAKTVDVGFSDLANSIEDTLILPRIDYLESDVLDHLAYFFHVDFYDRSLDLKTKRKMIKDSIYLHQIKGTPKAVEQLVTTLYDEAKVEEWFEYNGNPYFFRIKLNRTLTSENDLVSLVAAINSMKNKRSWLENITTIRQMKSSLSFGGIVSTRNKIQIKPAAFKMPNLQQDKYYAGFISTRSIATIKEVR